MQPRQSKFTKGTAMLKRLTVVLLLPAILAGVTTAAANVASTYSRTCGTCHDSGALGAPKRGDTAAWNRLRAQKGMDGLIRSTRQGMPQMPAMGLCQSCSNDDFKNLIDYMSK